MRILTRSRPGSVRRRISPWKLLVAAVIAAIGAGVVVQNAFALAEKVSYNVTTGQGAGTEATLYNNMISGVRRSATGNAILRQGILRETTQAQYFPVEIETTVGGPRLTVYIQTNNLYLVGFYNPNDATYYRLGTGPNLPPGVPAGTRTNTARFPSANYGALEAIGGPRNNLGLGTATIRTAANNLLNAAAPLADQARAILTLAQAISEAARFTYIEQHVHDAIVGGTGAGWRVNPTGTSLETNWDALSRWVINALNTGATVAAAPIIVGLVITTVQQAAAVLAVAHISG
jgi:hypothetical protein